jgi:hypothetical protein
MTIQVEPAALEQAAGACDRAAENLAGVIASLRAHGAPDTGRGDTRAAVAALMRRFDAALVGMGVALNADATALRGSGATYTATDGCVLPQDRV